MKTGRVFLVVLCLLLSFPAFARQITVTGEIKDAADGSGIPFAAVHIKGTMIGVSADSYGKYSMISKELAIKCNRVLIAVDYFDKTITFPDVYDDIYKTNNL